LSLPLAQYDNWRTSWDLAVTGGWGGAGGGGLLLYDRAAGYAEFHSVDGNGLLSDPLAHYDDWRTSWDLAVTGSLGAGRSWLLLYDRMAGYAEFHTVDSNGELSGPLAQYDNWRTSWDLAVAGGWGGAAGGGLLLYDRAAGHAEFHTVDGNGVMMAPLKTYDNWRTSWDLAVTGGWGAGDSGLLLYDRAAGFYAFYAVESNGNMSTLQQSDGSVIGATYTVTDNNGTVSMKTIDLYSLPLVAGGAVTGFYLAPIASFTLNLVGPERLEIAVLSSGAGTITYTASTPLTVLDSVPQCNEFSELTGEQANTVYSQLPAGPANTFTQSFSLTQTPLIREPSTTRRGLTITPPTR
jgi:hypothetical protein